MFLFSDVHINPMFLFGITIGTTGGVLFSVHKFMESQQKQKSDESVNEDDKPITTAEEGANVNNPETSNSIEMTACTGKNITPPNNNV